MRIAYLSADRGIPVDGTKGGAAHVRGLVRGFLRLGHELRVLTTAPGGTDRIGRAGIVSLRAPTVTTRLDACDHVPVRRALYHVLGNSSVYDGLVTALTRWRPDVVYERYSPFGFAGGAAAADLGLPHVLEVNASLADEGARYRGQALQDAADALERTAFRRTSLLVAVSRELADLATDRGADPRRVAVVPNGVDGALFTPSGIAAPVGSPGSIVIGFVGSLKPWHGVETLTEAFGHLAGDSRFHLLVVGNGPRGASIESLAGRWPGRVTWRTDAPHDQIPSLLRAVDVAVAPYPPLDRFYFSPLKVLEYMATGRAIVASRIGQIPTLLAEGQRGLLVPPGDAAALADAIRQLADDDSRRATLGRRAAEAARGEHLWTHRAKTIGWLMTQLVSEEARCRTAIA